MELSKYVETLKAQLEKVKQRERNLEKFNSDQALRVQRKAKPIFGVGGEGKKRKPIYGGKSGSK